MSLLAGKNRVVKKFHRNTNGQSMIMVVLMLFTLVCFFALAINVGHRVTQKVEMQNTIDASTYTAAAWNARGLNVISVLNVAMTECLAIAILAQAYDKTIEHAETILLPANLAASGAACAAVLTSAWGCPWQVAVQFAQGSLRTFNRIIREALNAIEPRMWPIMSGLQAMEAVVSWAAPMVGQYRASEIAGDKGAAPLLGLSIDGVGMHAAVFPLNSLPVETGDFTEICERTRDEGSENLVAEYVGWSKSINLGVQLDIAGLELNISLKEALRATLLPLTALIPPPVLTWGPYVRAVGGSICSSNPADSSFTLENNTEDLELCAEHDGVATWLGGRRIPISATETCQTTNTNTGTYTQDQQEDLASQSHEGNMGGGGGSTVERAARSGPPNNYPRIKDIPRHVCRNYSEIERENCYCTDSSCNIGCTPDADGNRPTSGQKNVTHYYKDEWLLIKCLYEETETVEDTSPSDKPQPYILLDDADDFLHFSGISYKEVRNIASISSSDEMEKDNYVVSRAYVYNPTTFDTFTQDWRVTLEPFTMEGLKLDAFNVSQSIGGGSNVAMPLALQNAIDGIESVIDAFITH